MDTTSITNSRSASLISYLRHVLETDKAAATDTATQTQVDDTSNDSDNDKCCSGSKASYTSGTLSINSDILALLMQSQQAGQTTATTTKLDDVFKKIDANSDGKVTLEEFEAAAPSTMDKATADKLYAKIDKDSDGSFTEDDLKSSITNAVKAGGRHHHHRHHSGGDVAAATSSLEDAFKSADTDGDGKLSLDEFEKALGKTATADTSTDATATGSATASAPVVVNTADAFLKAIKSYLSAQSVQADVSAQLDAVLG